MLCLSCFFNRQWWGRIGYLQWGENRCLEWKACWYCIAFRWLYTDAAWKIKNFRLQYQHDQSLGEQGDGKQLSHEGPILIYIFNRCFCRDSSPNIYHPERVCRLLFQNRYGRHK